MHGIQRLFALLLLAAAAPAAAQEAIEPGRTVAGELSETDPEAAGGERYDAFLFTAQSGATYYITLTSEDFDARLWAGPHRGNSCDPCQEDDDGGGGTDARLELRTPNGGPQLIRVSSYEPGESGRYTLEMEEAWIAYPAGFPESVPGEETGDAGAGALLVPGATARGELTDDDAQSTGTPREENSYYDVWTYRGTAGEPLTILMSSEDFDAYLRLGRWVDGGWRELASNDDAGGIGDSKIVITLPEDGTYEVHAAAFHEGVTGAYTLTASSGFGAGSVVTASATDPADLPFIVPGGSEDGELADGDAVGADGALYDAYRYFASAGETATFELLSDEFDAVLRIGMREGGVWREVAGNDDGGPGTHSELTITFPERAEYELRAGTLAAGAAGLYSLFASTTIHDDIVAGLPETTLIPGHTRTGRLEAGDARSETGAFEDVWTVAAGGPVTIDLRSGDFDPLLRVWAQQPDGSWREIAADDDGGMGVDSRLTLELEARTRYRIHVTAYRPHETGSYRLSVH